MRILMAACVPKCREGGAAAVAYNLGRELEKLGHGVTYVFAEDLLSDSALPARFRDAYFAVKLAGFIRRNKERFSVVNIHAPAGFAYGPLRRLLPWRGYPPYVMTLHGLEERRVHAMSREARKGRVQQFALKNRLWHRVYHRPRFWLSIKTADGAHCHCRDVWNFLQLRYDLPSEKVAYIPHGVEERFFLQRDYAGRSSLRLLYAGTWLEQRGIFYLREAMKSLVGKIPGLRLTIAGGGSRPEEIKDFIGTGLSGLIRVLPKISAEGMPELYAEHDIFVFPSLMEGLPCVLLEAMAGGMPVVTTETCGMVDVVEHEVNGLLVPPANAEALIEAILRLSESAELRKRLGQAAQETMRRYTWERAARRLEKAFVRALANHGA